MRFNPPPYWPPVPPGWTPPPGWQPDPSWPPPPPGWQLWVEGPAPSRRAPLLIAGGIAVALLVLVGVVVAVVATRDTPGSVTAASSSGNSDEEQIKTAVKGFQDAWNNSDLAAFEPLFCARLRRQHGPSDGGDLNTKVLGTEKLKLSVRSVDIDGDKARVTIESAGATRDVPFVHERDGWKWCPAE